MSPRAKEKLGGLLIALMGALISYYFFEWSAAKTESYAFFVIEVMGPVFLVVGGALVFVPSYRLERLGRGEDISGMEGSALVTPRWWAIAGLALFVELVYLYAVGVFNLS